MGYISKIREKVGHDPVFMPCVGCVIVKDNQILLQKRTDNGKWATHGGSMELGETFLDCLNRELKEELNIKVINPKVINIYTGEDMHYTYPNGDEVYMVCTVYLVEEYTGNLKVDNKEVSEVKWFDIDKMPRSIHDPDQKVLEDVIRILKYR